MARTASTRQVRNHRPNTTAAEASDSPPNENRPPKINAKTPLIMPAVATHPTEPSMEGVVPAADPVGQLERCQEEINHTRHDVQVRQPRLFHVAMVELILRQRARGNVWHVNDETRDDVPYYEQKEQADCYLNGEKSLGAKSQTAAHDSNDRRNLPWLPWSGRLTSRRSTVPG